MNILILSWYELLFLPSLPVLIFKVIPTKPESLLSIKQFPVSSMTLK